MPRLADLQKRNEDHDDFVEVDLTSEEAAEEVLVSDVRSHLSPAQVVEQKLNILLRRNSNKAAPAKSRRGRKATNSPTVPPKPR